MVALTAPAELSVLRVETASPLLKMTSPTPFPAPHQLRNLSQTESHITSPGHCEMLLQWRTQLDNPLLPNIDYTVDIAGKLQALFTTCFLQPLP